MKNKTRLIFYGFLLLFSILFFLSANLYLYIAARAAVVACGVSLVIDTTRRKFGKAFNIALVLFGVAAWFSAGFAPLALAWMRFAGPVFTSAGFIGLIIALIPPHPTSAPKPQTRLSQLPLEQAGYQNQSNETWNSDEWAMPEEPLFSSADRQLERERDREYEEKREERMQREEEERYERYYGRDDDDDD